MTNAASLAKMKKDELVALCKQYGISGYSKLKKDELVALLTQAMDTGAPSQAAAPEAPAAPQAEKAAAENDLGAYCTALVNLWGTAPASMVAIVYNQHKNASVTAEEVLAAASCPVEGDELIHPALAGDAAKLKKLRDKQAAYPNYVPAADRIGAYLTEDYRQNTREFGAMRDFMMRSFAMEESAALANTMHILSYLNDEFDIDHLMRLLAKSGVRFQNDQQFRNFAVLLDKLKGAARFWTYGGHTPEEAANFQRKGPVHVYKVGRNDPCPCGSGKKYKKCCGR